MATAAQALVRTRAATLDTIVELETALDSCLSNTRTPRCSTMPM